MDNINLCDTCKNDFPFCNPKQIELGDKPDCDNIVKCSDYKNKEDIHE